MADTVQDGGCPGQFSSKNEVSVWCVGPSSRSGPGSTPGLARGSADYVLEGTKTDSGIRRIHEGESIPYPFVAKPVLGMWGKNVYAVTALDRARDELTLSNGQRLTVEEFVSALEPGFGGGGYLFQERLKPHPEIAALCGERICSVRVMTILAPHPVIISALWKVAAGRAMADNFWEAGNLVAPVDADTGRVGQTFTGMGLQRVDVTQHPDTGRTLVGATLPD